MSGNTIIGNPSLSRNPSHYNWGERFVIRCSHPRAIALITTGFLWSVYFVWINQWQGGLAAFILGTLLGLWSTLNSKTSDLAKLSMGRYSLAQLHPGHMICAIFGTVIFYHGVDVHSIEIILLGVSFLLFGSIFGWKKVNSVYGGED